MNQENLFHQELKTRQEKIKYLFDRELENRPTKLHVHNQNFELDNGIIRTEKFWYPKILLEKYQNNSFLKYDIYNTGSEIYAPLSENHIELCLKFGLDAYSRTLRIYSKKKALKKILKSKNPPEGWEEVKKVLEESIESIYRGGNTINLILIK